MGFGNRGTDILLLLGFPVDLIALGVAELTLSITTSVTAITTTIIVVVAAIYIGTEIKKKREK